MKILLIGATGFIGAALSRRLLEAGHQLTIFHRGQTHAGLPEQVDHLLGEPGELPAHRSELERVAPEVVIDEREPRLRVQVRLRAAIHQPAGRHAHPRLGGTPRAEEGSGLRGCSLSRWLVSVADQATSCVAHP